MLKIHTYFYFKTLTFFLVSSSEIKLTQSVESAVKGLGGVSPSGETCRTNAEQREAGPTGTELQPINNNSNATQNVEETVNLITNRLRERRSELGLPDSIKVGAVETLLSLTQLFYIKFKVQVKQDAKINASLLYFVLFAQDMSNFQLSMEKTCMQKCLLYFEGLHGRPVRLNFFFKKFLLCILICVEFLFICDKAMLFVPLQITRQQRTLMKPFYDRYRLLKQLLSSASTAAITTIVSCSASKICFYLKNITRILSSH